MLKDKFMKMLAKKGKQLEPDEKSAKMDVMKELQSQAGEAMRDGFKKVSVASDSKEGLEKGLDKAKEIVEGSPEIHKEEASEEAMEEESPKEEILEEVQSPEECDEMIAKLMEKKKQLEQKV